MAKSKIGFHLGPGGNKNGIGAWERALNAAGQSFGLKAVDTYGPLHEAVQIGREHNVQNWLGFRFTRAAGRVSREVPDYNVAPRIDAPRLCQETLDQLPAEFDKAVWLEIINEPRDENTADDTMFENMNATDYLGEWCLAAAEFLNGQGYRFMGPSFNSGRPGRLGHPLSDAVTQYSQPGMLKYLRYCADHPDWAALSLHEYSWSRWQGGETAADWYPTLWGRFEAAIAAADLAGIPRTFHIFVTEFGFAHREAPAGEAAKVYLDARNRMTARWPQLKYDAAWTLQSGWGAIDNQVNTWLNYDATKEFTEGEQPARTHAAFGGTLPDQAPVPPEPAEPVVTPAAPAPPAAPSADTLSYEVLGFVNSVPNFHNLRPRHQFSGTWTLQNSGSQPWTGDFRVVYLDQPRDETRDAVRDLMGARPSYSLRELTDREQVAPGENITIRLNLVAPAQTGAYAFHWQLENSAGQPFGGVRWLRIGVQGMAAPPAPSPAAEPTPARPAVFQPGMNINPDAHPADLERLRGLSWVRFVFKAAAKSRTVDQAFQDEYRSLIQRYNGAGIRCLLILNQETEWGNAPWDHGGWERYAASLARAGRRVAELCAPFGEMVAYQIWNEEDSGVDNPSAIGVAADNFAPLLGQTAQAIRQADPEATIVIGGLNTGPENAVAYVRRVRQQLDGQLPVDALAYHPYGRYVHHDPFYNEQFGKLQDALRVFKQAFPEMPLWITEIGVADNNPIGPEHYAKIANYMREFVGEVADNHRQHVPVLIWFAWSDLMRNAGITTVDGELKAHIGDAFHEMVDRGRSQPEMVSFALEAAREAEAEFLRFTTTLDDYNAVPAGSTFTNRWVFRNSGGTTWADDYRLVYAPEANGNSAPMMAETSFALADVTQSLPAEPGDEVEIALQMTAPERFGRSYVSRWQLRDEQDKAFGHLYAEITVIAPITAGTNVRSADMRFVADQTVPDGTPFVEGTAFNKQWRVRNVGQRKWGNGFRLNYVEGNLQMAHGIASHLVPPTARGEEAVLSVPMTAPAAIGGRPTTYISSWRMQDDRGHFFGEPIWVKIVATASQGRTTFDRFSNPANWYSQRDPRWSDHQLGHGHQTIGSWGCLMTCYAMMLTAYGRPFNPAELNQQLKGHETALGFNGSSVQFLAPTSLLPGLRQGRNLRSWETPEIPDTVWEQGIDPIRRIDQALAAGQAVIAQVDFQPIDSNIDQHWVIITQRTPSGDDYLIVDPIVPADQLHDQPRSLMQKYGQTDAARPHDENLRNAIKSALIYWI